MFLKMLSQSDEIHPARRMIFKTISPKMGTANFCHVDPFLMIQTKYTRTEAAPVLLDGGLQ